MMPRRPLAVLLVVAAVQLSPGSAIAHPHVFIKHAMTLIFAGRDVAGVRLSWTFDEMYSSMLRTDYTGGTSGQLTPTQVGTIEKKNFSNLANYGFFLNLKINHEPITVTKVNDFSARFEGNRAIFEFTVPLRTKEPRASNVIEIGVFDPDYYVEFTMQESNALAVKASDDVAVHCQVVHEPKNTFLGPVETDLTVCSYAEKS
jgi:ABC-type uncharacterized transport system substrate-binding protein